MGFSPEGWAKATRSCKRLMAVAIQTAADFSSLMPRDVATHDLRRAYPHVDAFFQQKRRFDPENPFTSRFFEFYRPHFFARRTSASD